MCNIFGISASKILVSLPQCSLCEKPMFLQVNIAGKQVLGDYHYYHHERDFAFAEKEKYHRRWR